MNQIYIIQYNVKDDSILKERIKLLGEWFSYFPSTYVIESNLTAQQIYTKISVGFEKDWILIIQLDKKNYWGVLPTDAWAWMRKR